MDEIAPNLPPQLKGKVVYDATIYIQSSIDEVSRTLAEAVGIVVWWSSCRWGPSAR
jgi:multidrug efflux pump